MAVACAGCDGVVDRGLIIKRFDHPNRCCAKLPVRNRSKTA